LELDLKIIKDQQASSINNIQSINFGVDKSAGPDKEEETRKPPAYYQVRKRSLTKDKETSTQEHIFEQEHQKHQRIIKESFQEPIVARASTPHNLNKSTDIQSKLKRKFLEHH
jgi:hypothetical protein